MHRPTVALGRDAPAHRLTDDRRGRQCGVDAWMHRFQHHFSYTWLDRGGAEGDLMELNGWSSPQMLRRYGASARSARARRTYDRRPQPPRAAHRAPRRSPNGGAAPDVVPTCRCECVRQADCQYRLTINSVDDAGSRDLQLAAETKPRVA